jgi:hypothetical protein
MTSWNSPYVPYPNQIRFHAADIKNKWFLAGLGAGKSLAGLHEFVRCAIDNPESDGMIVAPTYPMLRDVVMPLFADWLDGSFYTWRKASNTIDFHLTGRTFFLRTATHPDRIRGPSVGYLWYDEPAMVMSRASWDIAASRLRCTRAKYHRAIVTTTPRGFNWLAKIFSTGDPREYITIRAKTRDNPYLPPDFEPGLRALYGDEFARQELDAIIIELQGAVWPIIWRVHVRDDFSWAGPLICFGGADSGFTNPAALVVGGLDSDGRWYILDIWYQRGQDRAQVAQAAKELQNKWGVQHWWSDHDPELISQMQRVGCATAPAEKDLIAGIQHVRTLFPVRGDGKPMIYVASHLRDWHREQEGYQFPPAADGEPQTDEEPVGAHGDHLMDATRYMIYTHSLKWASGKSYQGQQRRQYNSLAERGGWGAM